MPTSRADRADVERGDHVRRRKVPTLLILLTTTAVLTLGLSATALAAARTELEAQLTGANEVPPADPDGRGRAEVTLRLAEGAATGEVCFSLEFRRIGTPHLAHIHVGAAGQNGPPVVVLLDLVAAPRPATDPLHDSLERGRLRGCLDAPAATIQAIIANPAGYYVNIHNPRFPGGAIRGQLAND
jgi:CHRD domain